MKNTPIRVIVVLGALAMAGILFTQIYWVSKAIDNQEEQFNHSVQMALRNVVESLCAINGNDIPSNDPIDQVSSNYFIARTNNKIDLKSLDYLIAGEFQKRNISIDFEYGVYDCQTDRMVYGDLVSMNENMEVQAEGKFPELDKDEYYFGVYFPSKTSGIINDLGFWKFTTMLTVLIIFFFGYALFVILRQKRLSEIQKDFINNVTHEFKTPVATLKVASEVINQLSENQRQRKYASIIFEESLRLEKHVDQLLHASIIDHNHGYKMESVDLGNILSAILKHFTGDGSVRLTVDIPESAPFVKGESLLLEHVFFNLLDNAKKYGNGEIAVAVSSEDHWLSVFIRNGGHPIPKHEHKHIFKKFYRVSDGDVHNVKGFGLGLFFVQKAVKLMKGKVNVSSSDLGTCFEVKLKIV